MTIPGIFNQRDSRWASFELGWNTDPYYNLYHFGCAVVGAANIILWVTGDVSWTPARVNEWLHNHDGFTDGQHVNAGGLVIWAKLAELMNQFGVEYHGFTVDINGTNAFLQPQNNFALAQLTKPGFPMHFSAMPFVGRIADSWDGLLKVEPPAYTFIGAHLYTYNPPQPAPTPVQVPVPELSPAPIQAPVAAPLPEPTPAPLPPQELTPIADPNPAPGQTGGEVHVTVAPSVVPMPTVPHDLWEPFDGGEQTILLDQEAYAVDLTGAGAPKGPLMSVRSTGIVTIDGKRYYTGVNHYGVPVPADTHTIPVEAQLWTQTTGYPPIPPAGVILTLLGRVSRAWAALFGRGDHKP